MMEEFGEKTEAPTTKKLSDVRKKGFVVKSQDLTASFLLLIAMILLFLFMELMMAKMASMAGGIFSHLSIPYDDIESVTHWSRQGILGLLELLSPILGIIFIASLLINAAQVGFVFSTDPIQPQWQRLNFFHTANYKRYFGAYSFLRLGFNILRGIFIFGIFWAVVFLDLPQIIKMSRLPLVNFSEFIKNKMLILGVLISFSYIAIAIFDYLYQRWKFNQEMRMTKREVQDEMKQVEGDILIKSRIRAFMQSLIQDNLRNVAQADVVIIEKGHYAVALKYTSPLMKAPLCICKGKGKKAETLINLAHIHHVLIVENRFLAQSLFRRVQVEGTIPPEFYQEVAAVLAQASKRQKELLTYA